MLSRRCSGNARHSHSDFSSGWKEVRYRHGRRPLFSRDNFGAYARDNVGCCVSAQAVFILWTHYDLACTVHLIAPRIAPRG